jgi:hypothetical protein
MDTNFECSRSFHSEWHPLVQVHEMDSNGIIPFRQARLRVGRLTIRARTSGRNNRISATLSSEEFARSTREHNRSSDGGRRQGGPRFP